jgi:Tfp pilus assembly protein FimT
MIKLQTKNAITVVELLVALVVLSLLFLMIIPIFSYSRTTVETMNRLDIYHDSRKIAHDINSTLKLATAVLYPGSSVKHGWGSYMIFRDPFNQVFIVYINDKNRLVKINYDKTTKGKVATGRTLASNVQEFAVRRPETNLIEYRVNLKTPRGRELEFSGMVNLANLL